MDSEKKIICRLCLKIQDNLDDFKAIEEDMKDILDKLLQQTDFAAIQNPVMCTNCAETLMKCFDFKVKCINAHDHIAPFINTKADVKLDLIDVYTSTNKNSTGILEVQDVCGLCVSPLKNCPFLPIDVEGDVVLRKMIEKCVPEVDMNIIKKPVICLPCHRSVDNYFRFLTNHSIAEEKIKKYCDSQNIEGKDGIELSNLLQFTITGVTNIIGGSWTDLIKVENQFCEETENVGEAEIGNGGDVIKFERVSCDHPENPKEELELKSESFVNSDKLTFNSKECFTPKNMLLTCKEGTIKIEEPFFGENILKEENLVEREDQKCLLNEEIVMKTDESDFNRFEDDILQQPKLTRADLKTNLLMREDPLEVTMYKCDFCFYQTKSKVNLKRHVLKHKDPSEVTMYKCESCSFETKYKKSVILHLQTHKEPSEVTMYKCDSCPFQAKRKESLRSHLLEHKDPSELTMYKCDLCSYQSKHKRGLSRHLLMHMNPSELTMYKCGYCPYQAKRKEHLKRHLLKHKDASEVTTYKCDSCAYQTLCKNNFKNHIVKHKDPSEVKMYKCESCSFETKTKSYLKVHCLVHKDPSELNMYRCDSCPYQTIKRRNIRKHLLIHEKDPSKVTMYKCYSCVYETKHKRYPKRHLMIHNDPRNQRCTNVT